MKLRPALVASLFSLMAALSLGASAAADMSAKSGAALDTPAGAKVEKAAPRKTMRPHSHMEEKTGVPQKAAVAMPDNPGAAQDRTRHFHPRDGK